jgi:polysaccharide deacetylase family protein (PEP-CTERM system associated)
MGREQFHSDAVRARKLLEDIAGEPVLGYRSAGFSIREDTGWFFESLLEAGYRYDSSVFPAERGHGGISRFRREPHQIVTPAGSLAEFPITVADLLGKRLCFFGGGYLRLFPYALIRRMSAQVLAEGRPVLFYIHPREIDPGHPRLPMSAARRFKSYVNLASTEDKLKRIFRDFQLVTFRDYLERHGTLPQAQAERSR